MNINILIRNGLIMSGLLITATVLILIAVRYLAGKGLVQKLSILIMLILIIDVELGFILGNINFTPVNIVSLYTPGMIITIGGLYLIYRMILVPIQILINSARQIAQGDLSKSISFTSTDEIGSLADALREAISYQREMASIAGNLAKGNLDVHILPKSKADVLGNAFELTTIIVE